MFRHDVIEIFYINDRIQQIIVPQVFHTITMTVLINLFSNFEISKSSSINNSFSTIMIFLKEETEDDIDTCLFIKKCLEYSMKDKNRIEIFKQMMHYESSHVLTAGFNIIYEKWKKENIEDVSKLYKTILNSSFNFI